MNGRWVSPLYVCRGHLARACLLLSAITLVPAIGRAQIPSGFYGGPHLSKSDYAELHQASRKLLVTDDARVGATESWTSPTSGNSGTLTVQRALQKKSYDCRTIKSEVSYKSGRNAQRLLDVCQVPGAGWKVVS